MKTSLRTANSWYKLDSVTTAITNLFVVYLVQAIKNTEINMFKKIKMRILFVSTMQLSEAWR